MKTEDIRPGHTYEGADGERRKVDRLKEGSVLYSVVGREAWGSRLMANFAAWAVREVADRG